MTGAVMSKTDATSALDFAGAPASSKSRRSAGGVARFRAGAIPRRLRKATHYSLNSLMLQTVRVIPSGKRNFGLRWADFSRDSEWPWPEELSFRNPNVPVARGQRR